jgi:hypothetical protein
MLGLGGDGIPNKKAVTGKKQHHALLISVANDESPEFNTAARRYGLWYL